MSDSCKSLRELDRDVVTAWSTRGLQLPSKKRFRVAAMVLVGVMTVVSLCNTAGAAPGEFEKACTGFAKDPMLGALWADASGQLPRAVSPMAEVPRLSLQGTALATRAPQSEVVAEPSLESIFGVSPHGPREVVETTFYQESRAVVLSPRLLATVAHALTLDSVDVQVKSRGRVATVPLRVSQMTLMVHPGYPPKPGHSVT